MYEVISTGTHPFYGKADEKMAIADNRLEYCIKHGWIKTEGIKHLGWGGKTKLKTEPFETKVLPIKNVDVIKELKVQTSMINSLIKRLEILKEKNDKVMKIIRRRR